MAVTSRDTRARILDTAWRLVRERGMGAVTLAEIAEATGVSRQLLYVHFENRAGLLVAMARRRDARSGFAGRVADAATMPPVARALEAAAANGDEGGSAWHDRMADLLEAFRAAVARVEEDGRLADGWTVRTAGDWIWARCHLATWQHLVGERGWSPGEYAERTVRSILAEVVTPRPGRSA